MAIAWRPCLAELIGTFALCFIGAGAICTDAMTGGGVGLLGIAIAHGLVLSIAVSATGPISGGHINPAVTCAVFATGRIGGEMDQERKEPEADLDDDQGREALHAPPVAVGRSTGPPGRPS